MSWKDHSKREQQLAPWVIGVFAVVVIGIATFMNYGGGFHSHAADAPAATAPAGK